MISSTSFRKSILLSFLLLFISICTVYASTQNQSTASLGGTSSSVGTDSNTGAANVSVPVEVPPGRNGMAPNLALSYNSNKKNGWVGVGWDIKTSFIQRNTKWGLDYSNNDYVADGNRELTTREDWGADYYGHKTEGAFIKYFYNSSTGGWEATTKDGKKHYYGTTAASRQDDPSDATHVFKWMIDRVEDTNGNYITYTYTKDQGEIYLDRIDYTGGSNLSPTNYIKFYYDDSRTDAYAKYIPHFSVTTATRLITIEVVSNNSTVRVYKLEYDADPQTPGSQYSGSTGRSTLYSVQQYGSDASLDTSGNITGGTKLPKTVLNWSNLDNSFTVPSYNSPALPVLFDGVYYSYHTVPYLQTGDFNGDGKLDLMWIPKNGDGRWLIAYSTGTGFSVPDYNNPALPASIDGYHSFHSDGNYMKIADFNGDGKTDYMWIPLNSDGRWLIAYSTGNGFTVPSYNSPALPALFDGVYYSFNAAPYIQTGDFNGDGKSDLMWIP